ncbi:MAG: DUF748 domain-containing protein [Planctomycetota bacterium]
MSRVVRRIVIVVAVVLVLVLVVGLLVVGNLDGLVETGVEKGGTLVLGVPTELEAASVSLLGGEVGLDGLTLGSPEGFDAPQMFELAHAHTTVDVGSLTSDEIVVHEVVVDGAEVTLELAGGKTNWGVLMGRLKSEAPPEKEEEKAAAGRKIRIDRVAFTGGKIKLAAIPVAGSVSVPLPDVEVKDLRTAEGKGVTVKKALADVIQSLYTSILVAVKDVVPAEQLAELSRELESLVGEAGAKLREAGAAAGEAVKGGAAETEKAVGEVGEAAKEAGKDAGEAVKGAAEEAGKALKGVFGGGGEEE